MKSHSDNTTQNARIHINYKTGDVAFGYPNGKNGGSSLTDRLITLYAALLLGVLFAILPLLCIWALFSLLNQPFTLPQSIEINPQPMLSNKQITDTYLFFFTPIMLVLPIALDEKRFSRLYPKIGYWLHRISRVWKPINVYEVKSVEGKVVELPFFDNVFLHYEATDDFSKYLEKVDIVEHPFRKESVFSKRNNDRLWKAVFTFTEQPKLGALRIEFI